MALWLEDPILVKLCEVINKKMVAIKIQFT